MAELTLKEREALALFKQRLLAAFPNQVEELKLFGSKARGTSNPESDTDVLVVLAAATWQQKFEIVNLATDVFLQTGIQISPKVFNRQELNEKRQHRNMFLQTVDEDAVAI